MGVLLYYVMSELESSVLLAPYITVDILWYYIIFLFIYKATIKFPQDYPFHPPTFTFNKDFFHPNVYSDGRLCISILHPPGDDPMRYLDIIYLIITAEKRQRKDGTQHSL
jgi:hypothetical protein